MKNVTLFAAMCAATCLGGVDLNGSWEFRFEEGKSAEEAFAADFVATDTMTVPGCFDMMPKWLMKKGTGLSGRIDSLEGELKEIRDALADGSIYRTDPARAKALSDRLPLAEAELEAAVDRWAELAERSGE